MELPSEPDPTSKSSHNSSVRQLLLHKHLYLPHERMLHGVDRPAYLKILPAGDALKTLQLTGEVFPKCFAEIHPKTFLRKAIDGMLAGITKQVTRLSPYTFLATYAPLHSIEEAWKKNGAQLDSDVRLANSKATGKFIAVTKSDFQCCRSLTVLKTLTWRQKSAAFSPLIKIVKSLAWWRHVGSLYFLVL